MYVYTFDLNTVYFKNFTILKLENYYCRVLKCIIDMMYDNLIIVPIQYMWYKF